MPKKARISDWIMLLLGIAGDCRGSGGSGWRDVMVGENGSGLGLNMMVSPCGGGWGASESTLNFSHFYFSV